MMSEGHCIVCKRIPPQVIFSFVHKVLDKRLSKQEIHDIALEMIMCINFADQKNRIFFCGKAQFPIIGGLLYLMVLKRELAITQKDIIIGSQYKTTEQTIRKAHKKWLMVFPELFPELKIIHHNGGYLKQPFTFISTKENMYPWNRKKVPLNAILTETGEE